MKTIVIKGKNYVPVSERLKFFREKYPSYSLRTEVISADKEQALIKAIIRDQNDRIMAEGTSYERSDNKIAIVNVTSHVENAETSAWGRALGNFGIGIDASVASADEVANAVANQGIEKKPKEPRIIKKFSAIAATEQQLKTIETMTVALGGTVKAVYDTYTGGMVPNTMQASSIISALQKKQYALDKELDSKVSEELSQSSL